MNLIFFILLVFIKDTVSIQLKSAFNNLVNNKNAKNTTKKTIVILVVLKEKKKILI